MATHTTGTHTHTCTHSYTHPIGPSPVESLQLLHRLSLFPVVFALPPSVQQTLPANYAQACVRCVATTHALVQAQDMQVRPVQISGASLVLNVG
jgi:hypothetical protein